MKNNDNEKKEYLEGLEKIIEHSYVLENEFKSIKNIVEDIIEFLPNPLWVFNQDGTIFIQNSEATKVSQLVTKINSNLENSEVEYEGKTYLIKSKQSDKNLIILATDITVQKRTNRLKSMGQVAAHLSHEIRNPIGAVSLLVSSLEKRATPDTSTIISEIKNSILRVERIIQSTLLFAKGIEIQKKKFNLDKLEVILKQSFHQYSKDKEIDLKIIGFKDTMINGDFGLLTIVLQNFLFNSIDAIEEDEKDDGIISFIYQNHTIKVLDSGVAIEDKNILYEPFESTKLKGTGLGLALSLEIIKAHNGKIMLLEKEKGFKIWLK